MLPGTIKEHAGLSLLTNNEVTFRAQRAFYSTFKDCTAVCWYKYGRLFLVAFREGTMDSKALFTRSGYMLYSLSTGKHSDLPVNIDKLIRSNYLDFEIGRCVKVISGGQAIWVINLQDASRLIIVKANDDTFEELESHQLANTNKQ